MTTHPDPVVRETPGAYPAAPTEPRAATVVPQGGPADAGRHAGSPPAADWAAGVDTVSQAAGTPEELQPYAELGLRDDEYDRIRDILGRRPTQSELAMYSIMWSEHCSYKSSKVHLRQFGEKAPPSDRLLAGIGENAGVVRISDELAVTFKVESHNHPSFVEPYQGAATGVGGIVRDILAMGARPVAVMDPLRFGAADHPDTARVLPGVVAGVGGYGNCLGLPNIGGELVFDPCYQGNPLLNALCLGVLPVDRLQKKDATGPGNIVVLLGAKTGRDGIGGVSVLASATFDEGSEQRRPSVQVGDPFTEKLLIEACLELYDAELVVGIQDLGGAGLTCALTETAASAGTGMRVWLERVPLREPSMEPHEILASESQERMLLVVAPEKLEAVLKTADKWGVLATAIGEVTAPSPDGQPGRLLVTWNDHVVVDVPPGSLVDDGPVYARPMREPADLILLQADRAETLPRPTTPEALRETLLRMIASPNLADKTWVTEQYDRYVLGNTVLAQPEDSGVIRIDERTGLGVALSVDGNGRYARLDPYNGTKLALAEAYRNVAVTGAKPIAVTNCLNFGSPEDPGVMWQFAEAVRGLADGCLELGIPVTGGNVSFYNQTGAAAIHPTPVVGVLGVLDNVADRVPMGFAPRASGDHDQLFLLGDTHVELSGSEWAWVTHEHLGGMPPQVDLARERVLAELMAEAARVGLLSSAHDLSDGGLAQSLVESCLRRGVGARIAVPERFADGSLPFVFLFSESAGRVLVSVPRGREKAFTALCGERGVPWELIGVTDPAGGALELHGQFRIGLDELREVHMATLPRLFGGAEAAQVEVEAPWTGTTTVAPATAAQPVDVPTAADTEAEQVEAAQPEPAAADESPRPEAGVAEGAVAEPTAAEAAERERPTTEVTADATAPDAPAAPSDPGDDEQSSAPDKR
ncbi:phosphoribosylformylglycinamidine synthase subunit II [Micromonospora purpureochromogenes]|uniref:Phosphoribosylformylglycinamidine synthase subunit PurL n=1 Tax=Micromonospora purpureochromogenes TaxID=47872 RepID=A0A1C4UH61_9ACTN|nr:phosphoribosylformylglycinamidine synthase subunit PurL [Micromonospora purpureochromogenes]SCE71010.1 phosphoribosylformylglycinamidine synthase subunit II [Micromonospora purpureochromogenes]